MPHQWAWMNIWSGDKLLSVHGPKPHSYTNNTNHQSSKPYNLQKKKKSKEVAPSNALLR